jgi:hypothetical protein
VTVEAVYAAEAAAFGGTDLDDDIGAAHLDELLVLLTSGEWWHSCGAPAIDLRRARAGSTTSTASPSQSGCVVIRLAATSSSTLTHELAHALAGVASGHDATFCAAHVDVVSAIAGSVVATRLERAYEEYGVGPGARRWPPPIRVSGPGWVMT